MQISETQIYVMLKANLQIQATSFLFLVKTLCLHALYTLLFNFVRISLGLLYAGTETLATENVSRSLYRSRLFIIYKYA